jgi:hypothetical protein
MRGSRYCLEPDEFRDFISSFNKLHFVKVHEEFLAIQRKLFGDLGLSFQVLDMPPNDLVRKFMKHSLPCFDFNFCNLWSIEGFTSI